MFLLLSLADWQFNNKHAGLFGFFFFFHITVCSGKLKGLGYNFPLAKLVQGHLCAPQWDQYLHLKDVANLFYFMPLFILFASHFLISVMKRVISTADIFLWELVKKQTNKKKPHTRKNNTRKILKKLQWECLCISSAYPIEPLIEHVHFDYC